MELTRRTPLTIKMLEERKTYLVLNRNERERLQNRLVWQEYKSVSTYFTCHSSILYKNDDYLTILIRRHNWTLFCPTVIPLCRAVV